MEQLRNQCPRDSRPASIGDVGACNVSLAKIKRRHDAAPATECRHLTTSPP
jgi:hypothetical protein